MNVQTALLQEGAVHAITVVVLQVAVSDLPYFAE